MSEYKRLTERHENGYIELMCNSCKYNDKCDVETHYCNEAVKNCLAELEDKIENRTIIELPCKAGDTIYEVFKYHKPPFIQQTKVEKIIVTERGLKLKLARNSSYETSIASLGKTLFLTEEAAEARIKELQEKQKWTKLNEE